MRHKHESIIFYLLRYFPQQFTDIKIDLAKMGQENFNQEEYRRPLSIKKEKCMEWKTFTSW